MTGAGAGPPHPDWAIDRPRVRLEREGTPYLERGGSQPSGETAQAMIVIALTLACTALSIYDLLLLASGSA
ncbi:MAG TPA: hypothetical protein VIC05_00910 [Solirubrobacteraceae bacterium]